MVNRILSIQISHRITSLAPAIMISVVAEFVLAAQPALAQPAPPRPAATPVAQPLIHADVSVNRLVTRLVLDHMPHSYTRDKDWGKQSERWDGLHIRREGWKIETKRRKKKVNHGTWRRYSATLIDPNKQFSVAVTNIRQAKDDKLAFDVSFVSWLKLDARQSQWIKGVQLYSLSAEGKAKVRLVVNMELDILLDPTNLPPDLVLRPKASAADLIVDEFRIDRVSKLGGEFAQQVTRLSRSALDEEIAKKEHKLVEKINKELEKKPERLRLSISDALQSQWTSEALPFLTAPIRAAIDKAKDQ